MMRHEIVSDTLGPKSDAVTGLPDSATGKARRLGRVLGCDGRALVVAVDHSLTMRQAGGLSDMKTVLREVVRGGADAVVAHRGSATRAMPIQRGAGLVVHLSGDSGFAHDDVGRTRVCDPEAAISLGADAVSLQMTLGVGGEADREALADLGRVARTCDQLGLPLMVMAYALTTDDQQDAAILHVARVAAELGADIVKTRCPTSRVFGELAKTAMIPVVIAGGESTSSWNAFLDEVKAAMYSGIAGFCVGRRIFGHSDPRFATEKLHEAVHGSHAE